MSNVGRCARLIHRDRSPRFSLEYDEPAQRLICDSRPAIGVGGSNPWTYRDLDQFGGEPGKIDKGEVAPAVDSQFVRFQNRADE